jgi:hypothetical protein
MALKDVDLQEIVMLVFKGALVVGAIVLLKALEILEFTITIGSGA